MSDSTAREIIERAMANRSMYDAMAARESEVWGNILPTLEHSEARVEDEKALRRELEDLRACFTATHDQVTQTGGQLRDNSVTLVQHNKQIS